MSVPFTYIVWVWGHFFYSFFRNIQADVVGLGCWIQPLPHVDDLRSQSRFPCVCIYGCVFNGRAKDYSDAGWPTLPSLCWGSSHNFSREDKAWKITEIPKNINCWRRLIMLNQVLLFMVFLAGILCLLIAGPRFLFHRDKPAAYLFMAVGLFFWGTSTFLAFVWQGNVVILQKLFSNIHWRK